MHRCRYLELLIPIPSYSHSHFVSLTHFRLASKNNPVDEPGAFAAREWLRKLVVGKQVRFETRKQGASAGDRVYGLLFLQTPGSDDEPVHLALECVRQGHGTPKTIKFGTSEAETEKADATPEEEDDYEKQLIKAYNEAKEAGRGIHSSDPLPAVRSVKNAGDDFVMLSLVQACQKKTDQGKVTCVIEYVFDGSRFRCQVTDPALPEFQYAQFTLLLAGATCPRTGNPKADPPTEAEPFAEDARQFVTARLLQRELPISLLGTDKSGIAAVGTVHHPAGNIAVELLKNGLARITDWTVRMMGSADVPALRFAENQAKRTVKGVWHSYKPPVLSSAANVRGTVVEVQSGDTVLVLPEGKAYTSEDVLQKISLASVRAPRIGNERAGRPDEPYSNECKERLRVLVAGKAVEITIHYERDIPLQPGVTEKRAFGTLSVGKHPDISEVLIQEGLATTQWHRDDDEKSPRYDELRAAEAVAKAAKKGLHRDDGKYKHRAVIDLTEPRKAKGYSGSLMRAGTTKAIVDYVFNGALFKLLVPGENCFIRFAPNYVRCPQPSGSKQAKADPFGDESKRHARLSVLQRNVEIVCTGVTNSGIVTGSMYVGQGSQRHDYSTELLGAGLATLDQRKVEYGEVPKSLMDVEEKAKENKLGIWSIQQAQAGPGVSNKAVAKSKETTATIRLSEIRSGNHFFYHIVGDESSKVITDSMKLFTQNNGTAGAPCDAKLGKVVAALFDDGSGKSWYRAKIIERKNPSKVSVLFLDFGNVATVPVASHLRPLDVSLGPDRIPPLAKEATLALTMTRSLDQDEGVDAARYLQSLCWGKDLSARLLAADETGKMAVVIVDGDETVNAKMISEGLARVAKSTEALASRMLDSNVIAKLAADLAVAQDVARRTRVGMWRYGDVGDDDDEGPL